jgi:hypothetical protein
MADDPPTEVEGIEQKIARLQAEGAEALAHAEELEAIVARHEAAEARLAERPDLRGASVSRSREFLVQHVDAATIVGRR